MTIKTDDPEQLVKDRRIIDEAEAALMAERGMARIKLFNEILNLIPVDMNLPDANSVFLRLLAVGILQVHGRVKADAMNAAKEVGKLVPEVLENEWGSPGHQNLLKNRSQEVN